MRTAGLIHGPSEHHLDHLAPLCAILEIPLIVCDEEVADLARRFYPQVALVQLDYQELAFRVVDEFDLIVTALPRAAFDEIFFLAQQMQKKELLSIWCPHGNSDKGHAAPFMEALREETRAFVYGSKMLDLLREKEAFEQLTSCIITGNYRRTFARREHNFYQSLLAEEIQSLNPQNLTILYAPTWEDAENSSSFFAACSHLIDELPAHFNLIIKPHPNLKRGQAFEMLETLAPRENLLILWDFPPIYPLLEMVHIYLGDMSSVGYDFLAFDRPMFFINTQARDRFLDKGLYLYRCGIEIRLQNLPQIYRIIQDQLLMDAQFSPVRREVYRYTFGGERSPALLCEDFCKTVLHAQNHRD